MIVEQLHTSNLSLVYCATVLIGRNTHLARPSVCLSVRLNSKTVAHESQYNIGMNVPQGRSKLCAYFQFKR